MTAGIGVPGLLLMALLYGVPAVQVLLTASGQYRRRGLLPWLVPYLERWPMASDAILALMISWPIWATINGDPFDAVCFVPLYVLHQVVLLKRFLAKPTQPE